MSSGTLAEKRAATASVGMAVFLGTVAMLFAALFFAYAVMRAQAPAWPPPGAVPLPRAILGLNTLLLLAAMLSLRASGMAARRGQARRARFGVWGALMMGAAFLAAQVGVWQRLAGAGAGPASGIYGSVFFAMSGFHALHVAGGLVALAAVGLGRAEGAARARRLRLVALYWDLVFAVWALFFLVACL